MPKPKHGYTKPLTEKGELSARGKAKLQKQITKAESVMRVEENANRKFDPKYDAARRVRDRAQSLLTGKKPVPQKKAETRGDAAARRRRPFEKATPGDPASKLRDVAEKTKQKKKALVGMGKAARKKGG